MPKLIQFKDSNNNDIYPNVYKSSGDFNVGNNLKIGNIRVVDFCSGYQTDFNGWYAHTWKDGLGECWKKITVTLGSTSGSYGQEGSLYWAAVNFELPQNWFAYVPVTVVTVARANGRGTFFVIDPNASTKNKIYGWVYSVRDIHGEEVTLNVHCSGR